MTTQLASAIPRKRFFLEMFTRDISLEDCILDLIDNSIDGLVRSENIEVNETLLTAPKSSDKGQRRQLPKIKIAYSETEFSVEDNCGGISRSHALKDVFNFGHAPGESTGTLGVYGIGLKRAIFKIGNHFSMESKTTVDGFTTDLKVRDWAQADQSLEDWKIPLTFTKGAASKERAGTKIVIRELRPEVIMRLNDGVLAKRLHDVIAQTYSLFLNRFVVVSLNGENVEPMPIPLGRSDEVQPAHDEFKDGDVTVQLFASLAARNENNEWAADRAGWYALCNGRVVVAADKTELTGWGVLGAPMFHMGKYRGFVGVAFFQSENALALPWTTTKRGLNRESAVFQGARNRMKGIAKPILTFLDGMYKPDPTEESVHRDVATQVKAISLSTVSATAPSVFKVEFKKRAPKTTTRVQYDAGKADLERVRTHLKKPAWSAGQVGKFTFDYYLNTECPE